jgi:hypothetical protein
MNLPLVTHDPQTGFAYISLAERQTGIVATSVPLMRTSDGDPDTLERSSTVTADSSASRSLETRGRAPT